MNELPSLDATLRVAEEVLATLHGHNVDAVVIGAMALAVHGYPRDTVDLDLAVAVEPGVLRRVAGSLAARGYTVAIHDPDADDPLGGVVDIISGGAALVQIVNFLNPPAGGFPRLVVMALASAETLIEGRPLKVVDLYHLIAFKLYAGGPKSHLDVVELLDRNPQLDMARLRALCRRLRLSRQLAGVLRGRGHGSSRV
jgi:hypothetical protein